MCAKIVTAVMPVVKAKARAGTRKIFFITASLFRCGQYLLHDRLLTDEELARIGKGHP